MNATLRETIPTFVAAYESRRRWLPSYEFGSRWLPRIVLHSTFLYSEYWAVYGAGWYYWISLTPGVVPEVARERGRWYYDYLCLLGLLHLFFIIADWLNSYRARQRRT